MIQSNLFPTEERSAVLSDCGKYRYALRRHIPCEHSMVFIGLNPSTADAELDDQTIRKCRHFAKRFGYNGFIMVNLFAFRATRPVDMKKALDPIGPDNDQWLRLILGADTLKVAMWGNDGVFMDRDRFVQGLGSELHCLGVNSNGTPKHPLYLPNETKLQIYGGRT